MFTKLKPMAPQCTLYMLSAHTHDTVLSVCFACINVMRLLRVDYGSQNYNHNVLHHAIIAYRKRSSSCACPNSSAPTTEYD